MSGTSITWERNNQRLQWDQLSLLAPKPLLWATVLPERDGIAIVTLFDENTPSNEPNAYIFRTQTGFVPVLIHEDGILVRMLGTYSENAAVAFNAANNFVYLLDPNTVEVLSRRYYR